MNEARRAGRLRRAPEKVIGDDSSEPIAALRPIQRSSITSVALYDELRQIGRIEPARNRKSIAFATGVRRLGEFSDEAGAMRPIKAPAPQRPEAPR